MTGRSNCAFGLDLYQNAMLYISLHHIAAPLIFNCLISFFLGVASRRLFSNHSFHISISSVSHTECGRTHLQLFGEFRMISTPGVIDRVSSASRGGDLVVRIGFPRNLSVEYANVLVL